MMIEINPRRREIVTLIFCLLIGFALRFYTFDQKSLWLDEVHTFNDSRFGIEDQLKFYKEKPTYLHPPLFFVLTHLFYPFTKPERDLRIIPLIFGTLSIPMIYFLSRSFSPNIALPCTLSLTFMVYHIYFSHEGRSYSFLMFFGMAAIYFFIKHLKTAKREYLILVALFFALLFYTSYTSVLFIALSQILWFLKTDEKENNSFLFRFLTLNSLIFLLCLPWVLFIALNCKGQPMMIEVTTPSHSSFWSFLYDLVHDWVSNMPLVIAAGIVLSIFPIFSQNKKNAFILLLFFIFPVGGLYLFSKLFNIYHHFSSKYFISFLPLFLISIYLSLTAIEVKFEGFKKNIRFSLLFLVLFIVSNVIVLPFYYYSGKQDFKGLVTYLKGHIQDGDKIVVLGPGTHIMGILHYFGVYPEGRGYLLPYRRVSEKEIELRIFLTDQNKKFMISNSKSYWINYISEQNRVWIIVGKIGAKQFKKDFPFILKGYFDGSFLNFDRFPTDASMYLFLWDPKSPGEKGIDRPIE
jgi:4-amino-4-deoxy-L-arabinose transferase-like glycosyltransferase